MARNVEIKARIEDRAHLVSRAGAMATDGPFEVEHTDTFFECHSGRLKLRDFRNGRGELIFYRRSNDSGPKESFYLRTDTAAPAELRETLSAAYGRVGEVRKQRVVYVIGRTRVHVDSVAGLGEFVELEVVLAEGEALEAGVQEAEGLMHELGIFPHELVKGAYIDLLCGEVI